MQRGKNVDLVNDLVLGQEDTPQTHRTVYMKYHARQVSIALITKLSGLEPVFVIY